MSSVHDTASSIPIDDASVRSQDPGRVRLRGGGRGQGSGRGGRAVASAVVEQQSAAEGATSPSMPTGTGDSTYSSGRGTGWRGGRSGGRGRGRGRQAATTAPRPTHFLALPLHTHPPLRGLVSSFQSSLLALDPPIGGLDKSIIIDPRRLHLTLGVMALDPEDGTTLRQGEETARSSASTAASLEGGAQTQPTESKKTVSSALTLLRSLQPQVTALLAGARVKAPLERLDVFPPGATKQANVLFLGCEESKRTKKNGKQRDREERSDWEVLKSVADLIHNTFKSAGYITETRPLKLHCTILNSSHRKPRTPRYGFSFADILRAQQVTGLLGATNSAAYVTLPDPDPEMQQEGEPSTSTSRGEMENLSIEGRDSVLVESQTTTVASAATSLPTRRKQNKWPKSSPVPVKAGTYDVGSVELWVMGSHGENNEYVSLGGIPLE